MLPKKRRVNGEQVKKIFAQGSFLYKGTFFSIRHSQEKGLGRISVVVPKTIAKKANERILIRRRWYGALEKIKPNPFTTGDFVLLVSERGAKLKGKQILEALQLIHEKIRH